MNDKEKCELADFIMSIKGKKEIIICMNGKAVKTHFGEAMIKKYNMNDKEKCELADFIMNMGKDKMLVCIDNRMVRIDLKKLIEETGKNI